MKNKPAILQFISLVILFLFPVVMISAQTGNTSLFKAQTIDSTIQIGYGLALGDVDGDKKTDILMADKKQFVWYRNGDWKRFVMIENLTEQDNVCIAASDLDGDGKVEVAVGAQWIPSETTDKNKSGSVHFLIRPADPTQQWTAIPLYHEPTIHRMRWVKNADGNFYLMVLPLHGVGNIAGNGTPVNILAFKYPELLKKTTPFKIIETHMHATHNLEMVSSGFAGKKGLYIAGKEGIGFLDDNFIGQAQPYPVIINGTNGAGEVRTGKLEKKNEFIASIEPMHGQYLMIFTKEAGRQLIDSNLNEGHALIAADILGRGYDQLVAGWRKPNNEGKLGVKLYTLNQENKWIAQWIDENGMACEDLQVADLDADGKLDIIASGRSTHNLKIYWNRTKGN